MFVSSSAPIKNEPLLLRKNDSPEWPTSDVRALWSPRGAKTVIIHAEGLRSFFLCCRKCRRPPLVADRVGRLRIGFVFLLVGILAHFAADRREFDEAERAAWVNLQPALEGMAALR
jgi:hypothetical protein